MDPIALFQKAALVATVGCLIGVPGQAADLRADGLSDVSVALDGTAHSKQVQVTSSDPGTPLEFIVSIAAINPGIPWLYAQQTEGPFTTPASVTISLTNLISGFGPGPFHATVELIPTTGTGADATIEVTYTLAAVSGGAGLTVTATSVSLSYAVSGSVVQPASITVGGVPSYGATASTANGIAWLQVSDGSNSGTTLANVTSQTLTVTGGTAVSQLKAGSYLGSIALTGSDNSRQTVTVTLTVTSDASGGSSSNPGASGIRYQVVSLGSNLYRYIYFPSGFSLHTNQELDIQFDAALCTNIMNATAGSAFQIVMEQPGNPAGAPGHYSVRALIDNPPLSGPMSVEFAYLGGGLPAAQRYFVNQLNQDGSIAYPPSPLLSGTTVDAQTDPLRPTITSISPSPVTAEQPTTVTVEGSNFMNGLTATVTTSSGWVPILSLTVAANRLWLQLKMSATSPVPPYIATVTVSNPGGLSTSGTFQVAPAAATAPRIKADPAALSFTGQAGGPVVGGAVTVSNGTSETGGIQYTIAFTGLWLKVDPLAGTTQSKISITADPSRLDPSVYRGSVTIQPTGGGAPIEVPVTFTVLPPPVVSVPAAELTFLTRAGSSPPSAQSVPVSGTALGLTFSVQPSSNCTWLTVSPNSGTTPANLTVAVDPTRLAPDTYTGAITVSGTNGAVGLTTFKVKMTIAPPLPTITLVANAASFVGGSLAPGEIVDIAGSGLGPDTLVVGQLDSAGQLARELGGAKVKVNGIDAPINYVSGTQIQAVVPYELAGSQSAIVTVEYLGQVSNAFQIAVDTTAPGIFTHNQTGTGPAGWDASFNPVAAYNPISKGGLLVLYVTGEGQTYPKGVTGHVNSTELDQLPVPVLRPTVMIDGQPANWTFAGGVSGTPAGVMQLNVQVPMIVRAGNLPITVTIGNNSTQSGVTVWVK